MSSTGVLGQGQKSQENFEYLESSSRASSIKAKPPLGNASASANVPNALEPIKIKAQTTKMQLAKAVDTSSNQTQAVKVKKFAEKNWKSDQSDSGYSGSEASGTSSASSSPTSIEDRDILFLGEGNFSFSLSRVLKYIGIEGDSFGSRVIVSEYQTEREITSKDANAAKTLAKLANLNVQIMFGVDATNIHEIFKNYKFSRIQWNCPDNNNVGMREGNPTLPGIIKSFFDSAKKVLYPFGKIHMAVIDPKYTETKAVYLGYKYGLAEATLENGYTLCSVNEFSNRKGYVHQKTNEGISAESTHNTLYEYVFAPKKGSTLHGYVEEVTIYLDMIQNRRDLKIIKYPQVIFRSDSSGILSSRELETEKARLEKAREEEKAAKKAAKNKLKRDKRKSKISAAQAEA